jgi:uncharacterized OB-fold protein
MTAERRPDRMLGGNHDIFWQWCARGELRLQRCDSCAHITWPVADACERCGSDRLSWERMTGRGRIISWSTFERDYYEGLIPLPYDNILVELGEGPLFLSNPSGMTWRDLTFGMPVQLAFLACEDQAGAFALPVFERAPAAADNPSRAAPDA